MFQEYRIFVRVLAVLMGCWLAGAFVTTARAEFDQTTVLSADTVVIRNLIGEIAIAGHSGSDFEIEVRVQGSDATPDRVRIRTDEGRRARLSIDFPLDESKRYVYPRLKGGNTSIHLDRGGSWLARIFGDANVKVSGRGRGLEIWADVTVHVPKGGAIVIDHGVGTVRARDVEGDVELATRSGSVEVAGITGEVAVDTGSGHVTVSNVRGGLHVDTGSGHVTVTDAVSKKLHVDTGSGHVELDSVDGSSVYVDTGSGRVEGHGVSADDLTIDTGSGSVTLQLDRMGSGEFVIDTGSGSIDLKLPPDASADVTADTGSGGIQFDLSGDYRMRRVEDDEVEFTIGGGDAELVLDTGSGAIRISQ